MHTAHIVLGYSGAGKDTFARALAEQDPTIVNVKWSAPMKQAIALLYGINPDQLEDREFRQQIVPGRAFTWLELMIRTAKHFRQVDEKIMFPQTLAKLERLKAEGLTPAFTDIRFPNELFVVLRRYANVYCWHIDRPGINPTESDLYVDDLLDIACTFCYSFKTIKNDGVNPFVVELPDA